MRDFGTGFRYLLSGQRWILRHPRLYGLGIVPGLITLVLYVAALVAMVVWGADLTDTLTSFADGWPSPWLGLFRALFTVALIALVALVAVLTFTAVTLLIGQPFYDAISERVDRAAAPDGLAPESNLPLWRELWIALRDGIRILIRAVLWALLLFVLGFVPVVGQTVVPVLAAFVTGFFLTQELTAVALARRGVQVREHLALLRSRRPLAWGFGLPLGLAFLIPVVAVFLMPGAIAGATLVARDLTREPIRLAD
ncbi:hypothetical protein GPX89_01205 [Nocardia sp. ET3-3]|uniref:CysZ protein n=1 Tax=Nocardia terrae TaxID=2675851 RepID=A0A7K1UNE6_9NOCA|nr:EI24 domain-containing protein [Nocardia terrae]MVU75860.1 hypothetical protein [Nocardia terrae]